jgi:hypothetical protein
MLQFKKMGRPGGSTPDTNERADKICPRGDVNGRSRPLLGVRTLSTRWSNLGHGSEAENITVSVSLSLICFKRKSRLSISTNILRIMAAAATKDLNNGILVRMNIQ